MPSTHSILELRTSRDSVHTPETAVQLFAALPKLYNSIWRRFRDESEHLSFEIVVFNQTIFFQCYCPTRLVSYVHGLLVASYPEIVITPLGEDPLDFFASVAAEDESFAGYQLAVGSLKLKHNQLLPLKTYHEFNTVDPLAPLLSTLSQLQPHDAVVLQWSVAQDGEWWKRRGPNFLSALTVPATEAGEQAQKGLMERKISSRSVRASIKLAVASPSADRNQILVDSITNTFLPLSLSDGNTLVYTQPFSFFRPGFVRALLSRSFSHSPTLHLSLDEIATLYHLPNERLAVIPNISWGKNLLGEPPENLPIVTKELDPELKRDINPYARTQFKSTNVIYGLKRNDRRRHTYVIGKTGTGKSTLLANMAINDLKNNEGLCVIDPHGDLVETILNYIPSHRINDVVYFDPADPERTVKINVFEGENVQHRELIASGIVSIFQKLYAYSWGPRLEYILRNSLLTLLKSKQARLSDIIDLLTDEKFRERTVATLDDPILTNYWLNEYNKMPDKQRTEAIASILNKVGQFVSSPLVRDVVNARKSSFSIDQLMDEGKILLANLSQGRLGEDNAALLGAMLITKIQLSAMGRIHRPESERRDFFLYVDEFQNFATESFNKILSEARKYRLNLTLANQYIAQIPEEVQKAIFGNCGSMVNFVMGADDAALFTKEYGGKYSTDDLVSLGRYQIINRLSIDGIISRPFPAHTLSLASSSNKNREKVIRVSRERYAADK